MSKETFFTGNNLGTLLQHTIDFTFEVEHDRRFMWYNYAVSGQDTAEDIAALSLQPEDDRHVYKVGSELIANKKNIATHVMQLLYSASEDTFPQPSAQEYSQ